MRKLDKIIAEELYKRLIVNDSFLRLKKDILKSMAAEYKSEISNLEEIIKVDKAKLTKYDKLMEWIIRHYPSTPIAIKANQLLQNK